MNKKGLVFGIIVIILAVVGVLGYVVYDKFSGGDDHSEFDTYAAALTDNNGVKISGYRYTLTSTKGALQASELYDVKYEFKDGAISKLKLYKKAEIPREISDESEGGLYDMTELTIYYNDGKIASSEDGYVWQTGTVASALAESPNINIGIKEEWLENVKFDKSATTKYMSADVKSGYSADFLGEDVQTATSISIRVVLNSDNSVSSVTVKYENRGVKTAIVYTPTYAENTVTLP